MDEILVERVLRAVECVPAGRVVSYGDVAALVGTGPRQVGTIMRLYGGPVSWWRVTSASGEMPPHLRDEAGQRWAAEGTLPRASGGVRMAEHRADLEALAVAYQVACADLG